MPFKPGMKKVGGRKPGSLNKKTDLFAKCEDMGIDIFDEMLALAHKSVEPMERFTMLRELATYLYPKRKALELTGDVDLTLVERIKEIEAMPLDEIKKLAGK